MKKLLYLMLLAFVPMCFTACGDDDDDATGVAGVESLYGTWQQASGYAIEDGEKHHEKSYSADNADYLHFGEDGVCQMIEADHGDFYYRGSQSFNFDEEDNTLRIGSATYVVVTLSSGKLELRRYWGDVDYDCDIYKKVSDSVWDNLIK